MRRWAGGGEVGDSPMELVGGCGPIMELELKAETRRRKCTYSEPMKAAKLP